MLTTTCRSQEDTGYGGGLYRDTRSSPGVRGLEPTEAWAAQGLSTGLWRRLLDAGLQVEQLMRGAAKSLPLATAEAIVKAALQATCPDQRAGMCEDAEECAYPHPNPMWEQAPGYSGGDRQYCHSELSV